MGPYRWRCHCWVNRRRPLLMLVPEACSFVGAVPWVASLDLTPQESSWLPQPRARAPHAAPSSRRARFAALVILVLVLVPGRIDSLRSLRIRTRTCRVLRVASLHSGRSGFGRCSYLPFASSRCFDSLRSPWIRSDSARIRDSVGRGNVVVVVVASVGGIAASMPLQLVRHVK